MGKVAAFFWAAWHQPSAPGGQIDTVFTQLSELHSTALTFTKVEAEAYPQLSLKYGVTVVPTIVLIENGAQTHQVAGADVPAIVAAVESFAGSSPTPASSPADLPSRLRQLTTASPVMLFMKGSPSNPRCKFSRQMVEILNDQHVQFGSFDILQDNDVREGLKKFSNWPTYPQLYRKGELIGGLDIVKEMLEEGSLSAQLEGSTVQDPDPSSLEARLRQLVGKHKVMLFMKGTPQAPRCGFSAEIVKILESLNTPFDSFDILSDEEVRQGLKTFSQWPTYPQLYVSGELVGGLDITREMVDSGELQELIE